MWSFFEKKSHVYQLSFARAGGYSTVCNYGNSKRLTVERINSAMDSIGKGPAVLVCAVYLGKMNADQIAKLGQGDNQ